MLRQQVEQPRPFSLSTAAYRWWTVGLVAGILVVLTLVALLARIIVAAMAIDSYATDIRQQAAAINVNTAAVVRLQQTNQVASSILSDVQPISADLNSTTSSAQTIASLAGSIDSHVRSIDSSASSIESSAASIDTHAASIAGSAASINGRVSSIYSRLQAVLSLAAGIRRDTGAILATSHSIEGNAKGIDCKVPETPGDTYPNQCARGSF